MAGPEIENRSPGPRPVMPLYITAFTSVGVRLSGPEGATGDLAQLLEARAPLPGCRGMTPRQAEHF